MSAAELNRLEAEVQEARSRFAGDLARLRAPETFTDFKDDVWAKATEVKDEAIAKAKESATSTVDGLIADLKGKANANPGAVVAIGAGLALHLARHPPIASLLVGFGLWSLWKSTPAPEGEGFGPRAVELANAANDKVQDWSAQAKETVSHLADQAATAAGQASASIRETVHDLQDAGMAAAGHASKSVRQTVHDLQDAGMATADRVSGATRDALAHLRNGGEAVGVKASTLVRDHTPDREARDGFLLGAAAMAVTAAVGIAYQRRG